MTTKSTNQPINQSTPQSPPPTLSLIIVSWNVWDLLRACLRSVERVSRPVAEAPGLRAFGPQMDQPGAPTLELIVVDNASADATVDLLGSLFPWVRVIASAENLGFTAGNNRGYAVSRGRMVYFLNPDTELVDDSLWQLFHAVDEDPNVGGAGPRLVYGDGSPQSNRRRFPTRLTPFFESTWLGNAWPGNPWARRYHLADWPDTFRQEVDWLVGAALLMRRAALEAVMLGESEVFDEGFFMYSEEMDLCKRVKAAGWRMVFVPEATVIHYEGRSSGQVVAARHVHFNTSKVRYTRKYHGKLIAEILRRYLLLEYRVQIGIEGVKLGLGSQREMRRARIGAYRAVLRNGLR